MKNVKTVAPRRAAAVPSFSTLLDKKELAEETKYIRSLEAKRQEEVRQNLEKILALDDSHADKQQLIGLLGELFFAIFFYTISYFSSFLFYSISIFNREEGGAKGSYR